MLKIILFVALIGILLFARTAYINSDEGRNKLPVRHWYTKPPQEGAQPAVCYRLQPGDVDDQTLVGMYVKASDWGMNTPESPG